LRTKGPLPAPGPRLPVTWLLIAATAVATAATARPASAAAPARPIDVETLRAGFVAGNQGNLFKVGKWTPVWIQLRAGAARFTGVMEVVVPDDDGTPTDVRQMVDIAPGSSTRLTTYVRPGTSNPEILVRIFNQDGRRVFMASSDALAKLDPIRPEEMMLL